MYKDIVGTAACRIEVDVEGKSRGQWRPTGVVIKTGDDTSLGEKWRKDLSLGADHVLRESWVTAMDPHYERRSVCALAGPAGLMFVPCAPACAVAPRTRNCGLICTRTPAAVFRASRALEAWPAWPETAF